MATIDLAARYELLLEAEQVDANPNMADMPVGSTHWRATLYRSFDARDYMQVTFSQGPAHTNAPSLYSVLSCLASDAAMYEAGDFDSFEDYCAAIGADTDNRRAYAAYEKTREAVATQTDALRTLLGEDLLAQLLEDDDAR